MGKHSIRLFPRGSATTLGIVDPIAGNIATAYDTLNKELNKKINRKLNKNNKNKNH